MKLIRLNEYRDVNQYTWEPTSTYTRSNWVNVEKIICMEFSCTSLNSPIKSFLKIYVEGIDRPICVSDTVKDIKEQYDEVQQQEDND